MIEVDARGAMREEQRKMMELSVLHAARELLLFTGKSRVEIQQGGGTVLVIQIEPASLAVSS